VALEIDQVAAVIGGLAVEEMVESNVI